MKNIILSKRSLVVLMAAIIVGPAASLAQSYAARRAVDFRLNYNYEQDDKAMPKLQQAQSGNSSQASDVHEEKNTSPSPSKMQADPYHRTVSTGVSF
jgi:hypothetical protein